MHFMWTHFLQFSHSMAWQLSVTSCSHTPHGYSIITDSHEAESVLIESDVDKTDSSWVSVLCCLVITGPGLVWRSPERSKIMLSHEFRCLWSEEAKLKLISNFFLETTGEENNKLNFCSLRLSWKLVGVDVKFKTWKHLCHLSPRDTIDLSCFWLYSFSGLVVAKWRLHAITKIRKKYLKIEKEKHLSAEWGLRIIMKVHSELK